VYVPLPPAGIEPTMEAASPISQKVDIAGAAKILFSNVEGVIMIFTEALGLEHASDVTSLLK
jgi:hypothetical protein